MVWKWSKGRAGDAPAETPKPAAEPAVAGRPKIGQGHLAAMMRLGAKEVTQMLQALPDSTVKPLEEPGIFGNPVSQEVYEQTQAAPATPAKGEERTPDKTAEAAAKSRQRGKGRGMEIGD